MHHGDLALQERASTGIGGVKSSRREMLRGAGAGILAVAAGPALTRPSLAAATRNQANAGVYTFPRHETWTASPHTEISFRGTTAEDLGSVSVEGGSSGGHSGLLLAHADGNGVSFVPDARFDPGEVVTVRADIALAATDDGLLAFGVVQPAELTPSPESRVSDDPEVPPQAFRSRPDLRPPVMTIDVPATGTGDGYVFLGARVQDGQSGAMILDDAGSLVWYGLPASDPDEIHDVRVQEWRGEPVLTFAEANGPRGYRLGHFVICDSTYERIAQLQIGNGLAGGDHHEFMLTPEGTALIGAYNSVQWDLSSIGGSKYSRVLDAVIQEIEVETGRVRFEWHSLDVIEPGESYIAAPADPDEEFDYVHQNSIGIAPDGNFLMSARHTFAVYKIDRQTGDLMWRLNGKRSDFEIDDAASFRFQHDARMWAPGELTLFDNASVSDDDDDTVDSRGLVLALDEETMTASLDQAYIHPTGVLATSQGNMQTLPNGNRFIGWGSAPVFSEFSADGELIFNGLFPEGGSSYRAYRMLWVGRPSEPPAVAVEANASGTATVYASWNGATEVANWRVLAGTGPNDLAEAITTERTGFETAIDVQTDAAWIAVEALDAEGTILGASEAIEMGA